LLSPGAPTTNWAKVKVPMEWTAPDAHPDVEVAIAVSRATGTSRGAMLTNPGGPGGAGLTLSVALVLPERNSELLGAVSRLHSCRPLSGIDARLAAHQRRRGLSRTCLV
jgi:hypothetical protein